MWDFETYEFNKEIFGLLPIYVYFLFYPTM